jgi:hypothetical protein
VTSPFNWRDGRPSIFLGDTAFPPPRPDGKSRNQAISEAVDRFTKKTGRNPGTVRWISREDKKAARASRATRHYRSGIE